MTRSQRHDTNKTETTMSYTRNIVLHTAHNHQHMNVQTHALLQEQKHQHGQYAIRDSIKAHTARKIPHTHTSMVLCVYTVGFPRRSYYRNFSSRIIKPPEMMKIPEMRRRHVEDIFTAFGFALILCHGTVFMVFFKSEDYYLLHSHLPCPGSHDTVQGAQ